MSKEFRTDGIYTVCNAGGYQIMISDCGTCAKVRDDYGSDNPETSDWLQIEEVYNEDERSFVPTIDPDGYHIPLTKVVAFVNWFTLSDLGDYID